MDNHEIYGYFSLSSYYILDRKDLSLDMNSYHPGENKVVTLKYPAIQIDNLSRNHNIKGKDALKDQGFGNVMFNLFIVPMITDISNKIGSKIIAVFAADDGSNKLITFYERLHFKEVDIDYDDNFSIYKFETDDITEGSSLMILDINKVKHID